MKSIGSKRQVVNGTVTHTSGGLTSSNIKTVKKMVLRDMYQNLKVLKGNKINGLKQVLKLVKI